jgi:HSP20 family protein
MIFRPNTRFNPPSDVIELENKMMVLIEIAGMRAGDFNVTLMSNHLVVTGTRERPAFNSNQLGAAYHQVEIGYGEFRIEVALPWPVDPDEVSASYREGFLQIGLPRRPERVLRIVDVEAETEERDE